MVSKKRRPHKTSARQRPTSEAPERRKIARDMPTTDEPEVYDADDPPTDYDDPDVCFWIAINNPKA